LECVTREAVKSIYGGIEQLQPALLTDFLLKINRREISNVWTRLERNCGAVDYIGSVNVDPNKPKNDFIVNPVELQAGGLGASSLESAIEVSDLTVAYHRKPVLWEINLSVPRGVLGGIVGPNGAGKSTLIKAMLDLVPRLSGSVRMQGRELADIRHRIAYVPQRESVDWDFPATVLDVVLMGLYREIGWFRRTRRLHRERAMRALEQVGIAELSKRQISQLSGGQQQRTFLARALVQSSDVLLLDEPFAAVDAATEQSIIEVLREQRDLGKTLLVVHHDLHTVPQYFDYVLLLNVHSVAWGPLQDVFTEENLKRTYGGRLTILEEVTEAMRRSASRKG